MHISLVSLFNVEFSYFSLENDPEVRRSEVREVRPVAFQWTVLMVFLII